MGLLDKFRTYEARRKKLLAKASDGPLKDFLSVPFPPPHQAITETPMLAVDFETTGLDPINDKLLSIGSIAIKQLKIPLKSSYHQLIRTDEALKAENVIIHQITDDAKDAGYALAEVVADLLVQLQGKVMIAHFHRIEQDFLNQACKLLYGSPIVFPIIDTLLLQKRHWDQRHLPYDPSQLRLSNLRDHYQLPHHKAHNALTDALATGELLLAQIAEYKHTQLKDIICN